jgi:hypothetical protein
MILTCGLPTLFEAQLTNLLVNAKWLCPRGDLNPHALLGH